MRIALVFGRRDPIERGLDRERRFAGGEAGAVGHAEDVRVDGDRRLAEGDVEHDVGGFASDPGQRLQRGAVARHLAAMLLDEDPAQRDQVLCLCAKEADRADQLDDPLLSESEHLRGRVGEREERGGRFVDTGVGRLRRQHDSDQQGERVDEFELGLRDRARLGQTAIEFPGLTFRKSAHCGECRGACRQRQTATQTRDRFTDRRSRLYVFAT